jgi:uncharacterized membrane protein
MRRQLHRYLLVFSLLGIGLESDVAGQTFTTIDFPGGSVTLAAGINNAGDITGRYTDTSGIVHGFLFSGGTFTSVTFPDALWTRAIGINRIGDIVGDYSLTSNSGSKNVHGFLLDAGNFISFDFPGAANTVAEGINDNGDIVGFTMDMSESLNARHGFLLSGGVFSSISFPGAGSTEAWRINDNGEIMGRYLRTGDGKWHLYSLTGGSFIPVADFPGAAQTAPGRYSHVGGLNLQGDITSDYCSSTPCQNLSSSNVQRDVHGFLVSGGVYITIDPPGAAGSLAFGINDTGDIVGAYIDASGIHGYLRTP